MSARESMLGVLWRLEMRHLLRDRRAVVASLLLPLLLLPLVLWSARLAEQAGQERSVAEPLQVAFMGPAAQAVRDLLPVEPSGWQRATADEPLVAMAFGEIDLVVDGRWIQPRGGASWAPMPRIQLLYRADDPRSNQAHRLLENQFLEARVVTRSRLLRDRGFGLAGDDVLGITETDVATAGQVAGSRVGRWATVTILLFVLLGGSVVAGDTLAGEKERGTLETLLTTAAERQQIVAAKLLAILTFGCLVAAVQLLNLYVHLNWGMVEVPVSFAVDLSPWNLLLLAVLLLPLVVLMAGALLWISGRAGSYKEFHFYLLPLAVILLLPATAAALPGASLDAGWVLLPIANLSLGVRAVMVGQGASLALLVAWLISAAAAAWTIRGARASLLSEQQLLVGNGSADGVQLQPLERHVGGWFVAFWVFIFLALVHVPLLAGLIPQVTLTLVVVCLGGSLGLIALYGLEPRAVLGLRSPAPVYWPLVLIGAPALMLANGALYRWTSGLFPLSQQAFDAYRSFFDQRQLSWIEILAVAAVLPAICEELAFRGVLLTGLRRRLPEVQLCLVVGFVFAMFHFDLARFIPTLLLGAVLALVTLRSGSIYPAMLWHGLNNGWVLWLGKRDIALVDLSSAWYVGGSVTALCGLVWLWRRPTAEGIPPPGAAAATNPSSP